jgi:hypothetical protein
MSDNSESAPQDEEVQDLPDSVASHQDGGQQTSPSQDLDAIVKMLRENDDFVSWIDDRADRRAQSQKDRRISKMEQRQDNFDERLERYAQLRKEGHTPEQATEQLQYEDDRQWLRRQRTEAEARRSSSPQGQGSQEGLSESVKAVLSHLEIPTDNPEVVSALKGKKESDAIAAAFEIGDRLRESDGAVSASQIAAPTGAGRGPTSLDNEYVTKLKAAQGRPREVRRLKEEYRKKGVNVDGVVVRVE